MARLAISAGDFDELDPDVVEIEQERRTRAGAVLLVGFYRMLAGFIATRRLLP